MTESKYILFSSCNNCKPHLWDVISKTKNTYRCKNCGKLCRNNLKRKEITNARTK